MKVDTLKDLECAFASWRRMKKYVREPMPEALLARARDAAEKHGLKAVVQVTGVERDRLLRNEPAGRATRGGASEKCRRSKATSTGVPTFSRLELSAPSESRGRPLAEVETRTGARLRVFEGTPEMLRLLCLACGVGGVR
jgi:hypothetical protein